MSVIEASVDGAAPARAAHNQWTQFESFPRFTPGVKDVEQLGPAVMRPVTGARSPTCLTRRSWSTPGERLVWQSLDGPRHTGSVTFRSTVGDGDHTRVTLRMEYAPHGPVGRTVDALGVVRRGIHGGLGHFKAFLERRGGRDRSLARRHQRRARTSWARPRVPCRPSG
ncbi:SRPBCC family protein [Streptomyces sp. NPDC058441]|uniref:SRPBCC family protein n=1 Tax=Streptomyces sp. NPDC058441 TaxID=3346502 RepID=UPI003654463C